MTEIEIRHAKREDCADIIELKKELAVHSRMENLKMLTVEDFQRDGFDVNPPYFRCLLAVETSSSGKEVKSRAVGYALYHYSYAAFEGKSMHLEDLCVSKSYRGSGIGSKLMNRLAKICQEEKLARITLEVLDWNETAIKFYEKNYGYNSTREDHWVAYGIEGQALLDLAKS